MEARTVIFAALSGGVDSAVSASLLFQEGLNVIGVSHVHWPESKCCTTECLDRCQVQCEQLGIPYHREDTLVSFCEKIVDPFVEGYQKGKVINPCIICNEKHRFGTFFEQLCQHPDFQGYDDYRFATGHYVRLDKLGDTTVLKRAVDLQKDQTYMLYRLGKVLDKCIFPLGNFLKVDVRKKAVELGLSQARIKDSQDVCFVSSTWQDFIQEYGGVESEEGIFESTEGEFLGKNRGAVFFARGQRKGLGLPGGPWYVVRTDPVANKVILGRRDSIQVTEFTIKNVLWYQVPEEHQTYEIVVRYHGYGYPGTVRLVGDDWVIRLEDPSFEVCEGQSAVIYFQDLVLGGGVIYQIKRS